MDPSSTRVLAARLLTDPHPPSAVPRPVLRLVSGPDAGREVPVVDGALLGRGREAAVAVADPAASRRHARVEHRDGALAIVDLSSKNGIALNGRTVSGRALLRDGDRVVIGATALEVRAPAVDPAEGDVALLGTPSCEGEALDAAPAARATLARRLRYGAAALLGLGAALLAVAR